MGERGAALTEPFQEAGQQREAVFLGMWLFLATEIMLFGGLFLGLLVYRVLYPQAMKAVAANLHMWLGGFNTAVLLTSSLTMALAVAAAREGRRWVVVGTLSATAGLGLCFLCIKGAEYYLEYGEGLMPGVGPRFPLGPESELGMNLYFVATGLHAVHLSIGIVMVGSLAASTALHRIVLPERLIVVEMVGLYWHFVDIVWVFLYPALYLIGR